MSVEMYGVSDLIPVSQCLCIVLLFIHTHKGATMGATMFMVILVPNA